MSAPVKRTSKAQQFALIAEGLGWGVERVKGKKDPTARRVTATRGDEQYVMTWSRATGRERFMGGMYIIGDRREPVTLVKTVTEAMAQLPRSAHKHADGHISALPFDPAQSSDIEIIRAVAGRKIVWRNTISGLNESGVVPRGGLHLRMERSKSGKRILSFVNAEAHFSAYRAVDVATIRKVS